MGTPGIKLEVVANVSGLQSSMNAAGAAVKNGADTMVAAGKQAESAFQRLARATIEANTAQQVVKNTLKAISTGEIPLTTRASDDLALAQMEAAQAAREQAAAQAQLKVAMGETNSQMVTGFSQATLFSNVLGLRLGRGMEQVISRSPVFAGALANIFPLVMAAGFIELLAKIPEMAQRGIDAMADWNEEARKSYQNQIVVNNIAQESLDKQKVKRAEIAAIGTAGQAKILADQNTANQQLEDEVAKRKALATEQHNLQSILDAQEAFTKAIPISSGDPRDMAPATLPAPPPSLPSNYDTEKKAQARIDQLAQEIETSKSKAIELAAIASPEVAKNLGVRPTDLPPGAETAKKVAVAGASEQRDQTAANLKAVKDLADANAESTRKTAQLQFETGKITLAQEVQAFHDANKQKLAAEVAYLEGRKRLELQHQKDTSANGVTGYQAGPAITGLNTAEAIAQKHARLADAEIDTKFAQDQYAAQKQAIENEIAATKAGSQQRVQLEQQLSDYVRSVWGADSKQYREVVQKKIEAEREWAEAQKRLMQEASRATDEYLRKRSEAETQGAYDKGAGELKTREVAVRGQAELGAISPSSELAQMAELHQREIALEQAVNQQKLQETAKFIAKRRALLADLGGLDSKDPQAERLMREIQQKENLQIQLTNQGVLIQQKGNQTAMKDEINILMQRTQAWRNFSQDISRDFTTGLNPWIQGQKTFSQSMAQMWNSIAMSAITAIEQIAARWISQHIIMRAVSAIFHLSDAASATGAEAAKTAALATGVAARTAITSAAK